MSLETTAGGTVGRPRPTFVGLELRLATDEAEALTMALLSLRAMIESRVMSSPEATREPLLRGLSKVLERLGERLPPFDDA